MSILSDEIDERYPLPDRDGSLVTEPEERLVMRSRTAYAMGAGRTPSMRELYAMAGAIYRTLKPANHPDWDEVAPASRQRYENAAVNALKASRTAITREDR